MTTAGGGPASSTLSRFMTSAARVNLAIGIARQRLAHEIGVEQRLMHLPDGGDLQPAHNRQHIGVALRGGEEAFGRNGEVIAIPVG